MNGNLILQSDGTILLDSQNEQSRDLSSELTRFSRLRESQDRWHVYEIDDLSLWNAAGADEKPGRIIDWLNEHSQTPVSQNLKNRIRNQMQRYGKVRLVPGDRSPHLKLITEEQDVLSLIEASDDRPIPPPQEVGDDYALFLEDERGLVKQYLAREGWPVVDLVGYEEGSRLPVSLNEDVFSLRDYQTEAVQAYLRGEEKDGGSGVVLLPCGAGKTVLGLALMAEYNANTLVIATHRTARRQWRSEILEKTNLTEEMVGEYASDEKEIRPVTLTTYNMLTYRDQTENRFIHMDLFKRAEWGLIIYDEVHLLPAPVFRATAEIQSRRRLGLTATLVREDGRETDVFSLIGPKRYECPWSRLAEQGWISPARCREVRVEAPRELRSQYNRAERREQHRIASENPRKHRAIRKILNNHPDGKVLIIGYYLDPLEELHEEFGFPLITGEVDVSSRLETYQRFREGKLRGIILSKVGNYSVNLPNADLMIQVSGTFGSRQEEAQRLGRVLRPNRDGSPSHFYHLVTSDTIEVEYARRRRLFLLRQGYQYEIDTLDDAVEVAS